MNELLKKDGIKTNVRLRYPTPNMDAVLHKEIFISLRKGPRMVRLSLVWISCSRVLQMFRTLVFGLIQGGRIAGRRFVALKYGIFAVLHNYDKLLHHTLPRGLHFASQVTTETNDALWELSSTLGLWALLPKSLNK